MAIKFKAKEKTPWFPTTEPPARSGVYQVEWLLGRPAHAKFVDGRWRIGSLHGVDAADKSRNWARANPLRWRGLAADPKVAQ